METLLIEDNTNKFNKLLKLIKIFIISNVILQVFIMSVTILLLISINMAFIEVSDDIKYFNKTIYIDDVDNIKSDIVNIIKLICNVTKVC